MDDTGKLSRTDWTEIKVEEFLSRPFISEFVYRSPKKPKEGKTTQAEVVDHLLWTGEIGILISQKCQADPTARTAEKTESWARKNAKEAFMQVKGALRTAGMTPIWCEHPRLGRVDFPSGLPKIHHAIVIVEVFQSVDLQCEAANLPLMFSGTPVSYFSVNDFLNLAIELRTLPDLIDFLNSRREVLTEKDLRVIGEDRVLFDAYLLGGGRLSGDVTSRAEAKRLAADNQELLPHLMNEKQEKNKICETLEHVAHELSVRDKDIPDGISHLYEPAESRSGYLQMLKLIAHFNFQERVELGRVFRLAMDDIAHKDKGLGIRVAILSSIPEMVFIFGSSKLVDRLELAEALGSFVDGALAYYGKKRCLLVVDRDKVSYEVLLGSQVVIPPADSQVELGKRLFGRLQLIN